MRLPISNRSRIQNLINSDFFSKISSAIICLIFIGLAIFYFTNISWDQFFGLGRSDIKELVSETLNLGWIRKFFQKLHYLLYLGLLNGIAFFTGLRVLRILRVNFECRLDLVIFGISMGWSIFSIGLFWMGILKILYVNVVFAFLLLLCIPAFFEMKLLLSTIKSNANPRLKHKMSAAHTLFIPLAFVFFAVELVSAFSPIWGNDVLKYHMALPKLYIEHHQLLYLPGFFYCTQPGHVDMLYLLGLIVSGETLSKLFSFSVSTIFLISIFSIGRRYFSKQVGYLAPLFFFLPSSFFWFYSEPFVDAGLALFCLLGIYGFLLWHEKKDSVFLYLSIIYFSFAAATKLHGVFFVLLFFVGFAATVELDKNFLKRLFVCIITVSVIALPWYIRSWILTGDPIFPFFYNYIGAKDWNECSNQCLLEYHSSWEGVKSIEMLKETAIKYSYFILPATFLILPAYFMFNQFGMPSFYLFITSVLYYLFVLLTSHQGRFFYVGYANLCIIGSAIIWAIWRKYRMTRISIILFIIAFATSSVASSTRRLEGQFFAGLGVLSQKDFYDKSYYYPYLHHLATLSSWINRYLPKNSNILTWNSDIYPISRRQIFVDPTLQSSLDICNINKATDFFDNIVAHGITHLLYKSDPWYLNREIKLKLDKFLHELADGGNIHEIFSVGNYTIYQLGQI